LNEQYRRPMSGLERLEMGSATSFVFDAAGRMLRVTDPDGSPAPRFFIAECEEGNIFHLRHDVGARTAEAIGKLVRTEPPLKDRDGVPIHMKDYVALLEAESPVKKQQIELGYHLPNDLNYAHDARVVLSGTSEGDALYRDLATRGVPQGLREMGFKDENEFWAPWCATFHEGEIAAVAFAARLGPEGAATGVATAPAFRGKGLAAAAVASWSSHHELANRWLVYSHNRDNHASRRVAEKLGLPFVGMHVAIE